MQPKTPKLNEAALTPEQRDKLDKWKNDVKQLQTLEDIATMAQEMLGIMDENQKDPGRKTLIIDHVTGDDFVKILQNMNDSLEEFRNRKDPELPDYSKPIAEAVSKLEKAYTASTKVKAASPVVNVPAANVTVEPTPIDLRGIERILSTDIPNAFKEAIKLVPMPDIPKTDNSELIKVWEGISEQLVSIENATRAKPQPGSMSISNLTDQTLPVSQNAATTPNPTTLQIDAVANGNGFQMDVAGYATVLIHIMSSTAMSGGTTVNFEVSVDGSNWTAIMGTLISSGVVASTATADGDYRVNVTGFNWLRTRISSYSAGKTTILGYASPLSGQPTSLTLASGTATQITDGTQIANTIAGDSGQNSLLVAPSRKEVSFTTTTAQAVATTDVSNYKWVSIHIVSQGGSSTITYQGSNDNTNWTNVVMQNAGGPGNTSPSATDSTASLMRHGPLPYRYFRLNVTGIVSGTTAGVVEFSSMAPSTITTAGVVTPNGTFGSAFPTTGFALGANDGSNLVSVRNVAGATDGVTTPIAVGLYGYNGTNHDRIKAATSASNTTGTGLLGVGNLLFDGTNFQYMKTPTADGVASATALPLSITGLIYTGSGYDRPRTAESAQGTTGTGLLGTGALIYDGTNWQRLKQLSTATDGMSGGGFIATGGASYNGTTWDRMRNNSTGVVIAAGATSSNAGVTTTTYNASKAVIIVNISAFTSGSLTVAINGITSSGYSYPILTSAALAAVAVTPLRIFPGATASANAVANDMVPRSLQVVTTVSGTLTYGIDYELSV